MDNSLSCKFNFTKYPLHSVTFIYEAIGHRDVGCATAELRRCIFLTVIHNVKTFQSRLFVGEVNNSIGSEILFIPSLSGTGTPSMRITLLS